MGAGASGLLVVRFGGGHDDVLRQAIEDLVERADVVVEADVDATRTAKPSAYAAEIAQRARGFLRRDKRLHPVVAGGDAGVYAALCVASRLTRYVPHIALFGDPGDIAASHAASALKWLADRPLLAGCLLLSPELRADDDLRAALTAQHRLRHHEFPVWASPVTAATLVAEWAAFRPAIADGYSLGGGSASRPVPRWYFMPGDTVTWALNGASRARVPVEVTDVQGSCVDKVDLSIRPALPVGPAPWADGSGYPDAGSWTVPSGLRPGVYLLDHRPDLFTVVDDPASEAPVALLLSTNTFNSYSTTLDRSLYDHPIRVPAVAFDRPQNQVKSREWLQLLRWAWSHPQLATRHRVITDVQMDDPAALAGVQVLVVVGHSEYWTRKARVTFDDFVARGGHAVIAGGNTFWWQVRYTEDGRALVCHKNPGMDPVQGPLETISWSSSRLEYPIAPSTGGSFSNGGFGFLRQPTALSRSGMAVVTPSSPLLEGTGLGKGDWMDFGAVREYDGMPIVGFDEDGYPVPDTSALGTADAEIVAYGWGQRGGEHTVGTMHIFRPGPTSGTIVHLGFKEAGGLAPGGNRELVTSILDRAVCGLLEGRSMFSGEPKRRVHHPFSTPHPVVDPAWPNPAGTNPDGVHDLR